MSEGCVRAELTGPVRVALGPFFYLTPHLVKAKIKTVDLNSAAALFHGEPVR